MGLGKSIVGTEIFEYDGVGLPQLSQMFAETFTAESADSSVQGLHDDMIKKKQALIGTLQREMPEIVEVQSQHDEYVAAEAQYKIKKVCTCFCCRVTISSVVQRNLDNKNATLESKRSKLLKRINQIMEEANPDFLD